MSIEPHNPQPDSPQPESPRPDSPSDANLFSPPSTHRVPAEHAPPSASVEPAGQDQPSAVVRPDGDVGAAVAGSAAGLPGSPAPAEVPEPTLDAAGAPVLAPMPTDSWGRVVPPPAERRPRRSMSPLVLVPMLLLALVAGAAGGVLADRLTDEQRPTDAALPLYAGEPADLGQLTGVAAIAAKVLPSVVSIEVRGTAGEGTGSGFVLRENGYILTNNHVVAASVGDEAEIVVVFADGSEEPAELVGRTSEYDLAVIKVDRTGLTALVLGDSDKVVVGEPVVAVGAPLGLQGTVTTGIVSALNRPVSTGSTAAAVFINAIQTDAAINPGNSGGPLVNAAGQVIGINSAIAQPPGSALAAGSIGLGFAITSNQARRTAEQLIETGEATYPVIGVLLDGRYTGEGVQVTTEPQDGQEPVTPDGPADRAGIQPGDIIVAIDGRPVTQADELIVAIRAKAPGDAVTLTVRTAGDEREVRVVLDEFTSE
nr:trypsin-like peptidase domain-containing protein [Cellulomonas sp. KRMCY2]